MLLQRRHHQGPTTIITDGSSILVHSCSLGESLFLAVSLYLVSNHSFSFVEPNPKKKKKKMCLVFFSFQEIFVFIRCCGSQTFQKPEFRENGKLFFFSSFSPLPTEKSGNVLRLRVLFSLHLPRNRLTAAVQQG